MNRIFNEDGPAELYDAEAEKNSAWCDICGSYHDGDCPEPVPLDDEVRYKRGMVD